MSNSLEERLQTHSNAFDGLLSLIPAKYYYDESTQDQWQQKKKSKDEIKLHKRAKLDPESQEYEGKLSAKEVMDNKAKTAKPVQLPGRIASKQGEKTEAAQEQEEPKEQDKHEDGDNQSEDSDSSEVEIPDMDVDDEITPKESRNEDEDIQIDFDDEGNEIVDEDKTKKVQKPVSTKNAAEGKKKKKELSEEEVKKRQENLKLLRDKLASKINTLKEKRKAPGAKTTGAPKSREQILEERKRKAELKRQEKLKRKHEEVDSEASSDPESEDEEPQERDADGNLVFGNIAFNDGSRVTSDFSHLRKGSKKNGPANKDIKAHLLRLEKHKQKLANMSPEEQKAHQEKDKWQRLMSQAEGVKVKDDEKLLKKALKRKERQKLRSEIEWKERQKVVKDTMSARQKRREENLKMKQQNKGKKRKHQVKLRKFTGIVNKNKPKPDLKKKDQKKRAGFEGSAKSKKK